MGPGPSAVAAGDSQAVRLLSAPGISQPSPATDAASPAVPTSRPRGAPAESGGAERPADASGATDVAGLAARPPGCGGADAPAPGRAAGGVFRGRVLVITAVDVRDAADGGVSAADGVAGGTAGAALDSSQQRGNSRGGEPAAPARRRREALRHRGATRQLANGLTGTLAFDWDVCDSAEEPAADPAPGTQRDSQAAAAPAEGLDVERHHDSGRPSDGRHPNPAQPPAGAEALAAAAASQLHPPARDVAAAGSRAPAEGEQQQQQPQPPQRRRPLRRAQPGLTSSSTLDMPLEVIAPRAARRRPAERKYYKRLRLVPQGPPGATWTTSSGASSLYLPCATRWHSCFFLQSVLLAAICTMPRTAAARQTRGRFLLLSGLSRRSHGCHGRAIGMHSLGLGPVAWRVLCMVNCAQAWHAAALDVAATTLPFLIAEAAVNERGGQLQ